MFAILWKAFCVICVSVCGAQANVSPANDTESRLIAEGTPEQLADVAKGKEASAITLRSGMAGARGQLTEVAKGKETSAITLRSGMAAMASSDIEARYFFGRDVSVGSGCSESACQGQVPPYIVVKAIPDTSPLKMVGVQYVIQKPYKCSVELFRSRASVALMYDFNVNWKCDGGFKMGTDVDYESETASVDFGWNIQLSFNHAIISVSKDQDGNKGRFTISTIAVDNLPSYIESVGLFKSTGKPELKLGASAERTKDCSGEKCVDGPATYFQQKGSDTSMMVKDLRVSDDAPDVARLRASQ